MSGLLPPPLYLVSAEDSVFLPMDRRAAPRVPGRKILRRLGQSKRSVYPHTSVDSFLGERLGLHPLPWAALWLAAHGTPLKAGEQAFLLTPLEMKADMNALRVRPAVLLEADRARTLSLLKPWLAESGGALEWVHGHVLLRLPQALAVSTTALHLTEGKDLRDCLPEGKDRGLLRRWMTECQMALHENGSLPLQGVWFWGEAATPLPPLDERLPDSPDPWLQALLRLPGGDRIHHRLWDAPGLFDAMTEALGAHPVIEVLLLSPSESPQRFELKRTDVLRFWRAPVRIVG